ncbi:hypothetical protein Btru_070396 [Bulinus truncatus]|nr:hypothetical protein Btru_070396 [Bulinus truncatus]
MKHPHLSILFLTLFRLDKTFQDIENQYDYSGQEMNYRQSSGPCDQMITFEGLTIDCSSRGLQAINNSWFPEETNVISLTNNLITVIQNTSFEGLSLLRVLDLSYNKINTIHSDAFVHLSSLESLNMEFNLLKLTQLPTLVFCPLVNLLDLLLRFQKCHGVGKENPGTRENQMNYYPNGMFGCLRNLLNLTVDTLGGFLFFDDQFRNLINLTRIGLSCDLDIVNASSIENVKSIRFFTFIYSWDIGTFDALTLSNLTSMDFFSLTYISTGLYEAMLLLKPLVNKNMTAIVLTEVIKKYTDKSLSISTGDGILTENATHYLTAICVSNVGMSRNSIFVIETRALTSDVWNRCLKTLDLRGNYILGKRESITRMFSLSVLETLLLSTGFNSIIDDFSGNPLNSKHLEQPRYSSKASMDTGSLSLLPAEYLLHEKKGLAKNNQTGLIVYVSPSLRFLNLNTFAIDVDFSTNIFISGADKLQFLDFSNNIGHHFLGNLTGLTGLFTLLLSGNVFTFVSEIFFDNFPNLTELYLSHCKFDSVFMSKYSNRLFQSLTRLTSLDLSYNSLTILSPGTFESNRKLIQLNLEGNRFTSIPFDLGGCPVMLYLNMKSNSITAFDERSIDTLEDIMTRTGHLSLSLSGNILSCSCSNFLFLKWIHETNVSLDNNGNYTCLDNNFQLSCTNCIEDMEDLWRQCSGQAFLYASLVMLCTTLVVILFVYMFSQKKTFFLSILYEFANGFRLNTIEDYLYKVYIVTPDELDLQRLDFITHVLMPYFENVLGLRTFLGNRDGFAGKPLLAANLDPIPDSWRVVFFLSPGFEGDEMLQFVVSTAIAAQSPANPGQLVFLVHEDYLDLVPNEWINAVPRENIILLPTLELTYRVEQTLRTRLLQKYGDQVFLVSTRNERKQTCTAHPLHIPFKPTHRWG